MPDITMNAYQQCALDTAIYPDHIGLAYTALGLAGEAGEICNKVKKVYRDHDGVIPEEKLVALRSELGDVLWYAATLAHELDTHLGTVAEENVKKLASRQQRGKLGGDGDNR